MPKELFRNPPPLEQILPSFQIMYNNLTRTGRAYDRRGTTQRVLLGHGLTYQDKQGQSIPALVDQQIMQNVPRISATDLSVQEALTDLRDGIPAESAISYLNTKLGESGLIIGFSGYGDDRREYDVEGQGIQQILKELKQRDVPIDLVIDGATCIGVPGLSGLLAREQKMENLGFVPLEGLRSIAPRDATIVVGTHYGDETKTVGTIPDILFILGGGPGTTKEYQAALDAGNNIVILKLKEYQADSLANTYVSKEKTQTALDEGKLIVCEDLDSIGGIIEQLTTPEKLAEFHKRRAAKKSYLEKLTL